MTKFQSEIVNWCTASMGVELTYDKSERNRRTAEEFAELMQCSGMPLNELISHILWVYKKPPGKPKDEIADAAICLALQANAYNINVDEAVAFKLPQLWNNCAAIKDKRDKKPLIFIP